MTRESSGTPGAGLWTRSRFQKLKPKDHRTPRSPLRIEVSEPPFWRLLITASSDIIPKMPDQAPANIDNPRHLAQHEQTACKHSHMRASRWLTHCYCKMVANSPNAVR